MKTKDKNNVVLAISGALIILAIIIAITATIVEHKKSKEELTEPRSEAVQNLEDNKVNKNDKPQNPGDTAPQVTTTKPQSNPVTDTNKPGKYKVVTKDDPLGVRIVPKAAADRVTEIPKGGEIQVLATFADWGYVEVDSVSGWVSLNYLELVSASDKVPTHTAGNYVIGTKDDPLGIRTKPMNDASRDGEVPKGTTVKILTVYDNWGYVEYEGKQGWLSFDYLKAE